MVLIQQELVLVRPQLVLVQQAPVLVQELVAEPLQELVLVELELNELATEHKFELSFVIPQ